jgi:hypothetical protein
MGVSVTPRPLSSPGKEPVPIVREAGWAPGPVWTCAKNLAPAGIRSPDRPARSQSLYLLSCPAHTHYSVQGIIILLFSLALKPSAGYGHLVAWGFFITHNDAPQSVGLHWMSDQLVAQTSAWQHTHQTNIHAPVGFEPTIATGERP